VPSMTTRQRWFLRMLRVITPVTALAFRLSRGRLERRMTAGAPILLLTTVGRRSGKRRTVAVGYTRDGRDVFVYGTGGGLPREPGWVRNLRANPTARVEMRGATFVARPIWLEGPEREEHWNRLMEEYEAYRDVPRTSGREIPVIRLDPLPDSTT
jgi:deazaflavin-dependent oxidoreductase (nitroreductase family)